MVIVSKADDGNVVGLILPSGQFFVLREFAKQLVGRSFEHRQNGAIQFFFTGCSDFHNVGYGRATGADVQLTVLVKLYH